MLLTYMISLFVNVTINEIKCTTSIPLACHPRTVETAITLRIARLHMNMCDLIMCTVQ